MDVEMLGLANRVMELWIEAAGIPLERYGKFTFGQISAQKTALEIAETTAWDPSGATTLMMLYGEVLSELQSMQFPGIQVIRDLDSIRDTLRPFHGLLRILEAPEVMEMFAAHADVAREAISHYNVTRDDLEPWLVPYQLGQLRRDAFHAVATLERHQFVQGQHSTSPLPINAKVIEVWNTNSMIAALRDQPGDGVTVFLVRSPEALHSYFCIGVRDGDNITILTDRAPSHNQRQQGMRRRPDRDFQRRACEHRFPYQLIKVAVTEDGKELYAAARRDLVPYDRQLVPLAQVHELDPDQLLWLWMVAELLEKQLRVGQWKAAELSYTGEMVVVPHALVGEHSGLVKAGTYRPLSLPRLTDELINADATRDLWQYKPTGHNGWLEDKFGHLVDEDAYNLTGQPALTEDLYGRRDKVVTPPVIQLPGSDRLLTFEGRPASDHLDHMRYVVKLGDTELSATAVEMLHSTDFGTPAYLQKRRVFAARYNRARAIQKLADDHFEKTLPEVLNWYKRRITARKAAFESAVATAEWFVPPYGRNRGFDATLGRDEDKPWTNCVEQIHRANGDFSWDPREHVVMNDGASMAHRQNNRCWTDPTRPATVLTAIQPLNAEAMAILLGVDEDELPEPLQHWTKDEPYTGNHILSDIDPMEWALKNPWRRLKWKIILLHSKHTVNQLRAARGLPPHDWAKLDKGPRNRGNWWDH